MAVEARRMSLQTHMGRQVSVEVTVEESLTCLMSRSDAQS